ncbi:murein hydrolase activator EnvC family protein [Cohnella silvisoli]|uniref:Peptidoglycan DD-metalloendopeptidase family protein n=1 Tax=Cohnella silvisoli TaxID=2873699 RepID=A0ABV1KPL8_9BACL|nr:peptidoglycan DD-metalloendopeptidase family protein [Cohnella silvisoli]MCD9022343.1 peptidoglycan DD-metalloendopeptidase family protein [Cohnella silvisoli]
MKRKLVLLLAMLLVTALIVKPYDGQALSEIQKIDRDLKQLKEDMARAAHNQKNAENNVKALTGKKEATKGDIEALLGRIDQVQKKLETTQSKIAVAEEKLYVTGEELQDAIKQLNNRRELMDSRVRLAYTTGAVSYLDVLLSSTSFTDFLDRFDAVESIVTQDRNIADEKKAYSDEVTAKKAQIEQELKDVKALYAEMEDHKAELEQNEKDKEVMMSKIAKQIEDMEEISEESEKQLTELAKKASALEAKKNRIKNYYKGGKLGMPLKSEWHLSSPFGYRIHPISGKKKLHSGMDMAAPKGTPVYAAETGVVIVAQSWSGYGNCIIIDHGGGLWTLYGHLMNGGVLVEKGETVKRGEKIGMVGSTGQSTGNHLHFEVRKNSEPVNPAPYLK